MGEAIRILRAVAEALVADPWGPTTPPDRVRPDNLGLSPTSGRVLLLDAPSTPCALRYRAPEAVDHVEQEVDERVELYSLGVLAYELLTGSPPFVTDDPMALAHAHLATAPAPVDATVEVPPGLAAIVHRLLEKEADRRYASAHGLLHDLRRAEASWERRREIPVFPLGAADVPRTLRPDPTWIGRDAARQELELALTHARRGRPAHVQLLGPPYAGVEPMAAAFLRAVRLGGGAVGIGRFDRALAGLSTPWRDGLRSLLRALPPGADDERAAFQGELGLYARVLLDWLPELEHHLRHPPSEAAVGEAGVDRRVGAVRALLGVIGALHPGAVLALHRTDAAAGPARDLLDALRDDPVPGVIVLEVAWGREDDEVPPSVRRVVLAPLDVEQVIAWTAHTTHTAPQQVEALGRALWSRTGGLPVAMGELLSDWARRGLVSWTPAGWTHAPGAFDDEPVVTEVAELLARRLDRLPTALRGFLAVAAHVPTLEPELLARVAEEPVERVAAWIEAATEAGVLLRRPDGRAAWSHRQIRATLAEGVSPEAIHRRVARAWIQQVDPRPDPIALGTLARSGGLGLDGEEQTPWMGVYALAAAACLQHLAYPEAHRFALAALAAAGPDGYVDPALLLVRARAAFHIGALDDMEEALDRIRAGTRDVLERVDAELLHIQAELAGTRWGEATDRAVAVLAELGVRLPRHPGRAQVAAELVRALGAVRGTDPVAIAEGPIAEDPRDVAVDQLLLWCATAAYFAAPDLVPICGMCMTRLAASRGVTEDSAFGLALMGLVEAGVLERFSVAQAWADAAERLLARLPNPGLQGKVGLLIDGFVRGWSRPLQGQIDAVLARRRGALAAGDETFAVYCGATAVYNAFAAGVPLEAIGPLVEEAVAHARDSQQRQAWPMFAAWRQLHASLASGGTELVGAWFDWGAARARFEEDGDGNSLGHGGIAAGVLAYACGDLEAAAAHLQVAYRALDGVVGQCVVAVHRAFSGLTHAALAQQTTGLSRQRHLLRARYDRARLGRLAAANPMDLEGWRQLLDAELHAASGRWLDALRTMDEALSWALQHGRDHDIALIEQRAAEVCRRVGLSEQAPARRARAAEAWRRYGAHGRAAALTGERAARDPQLGELGVVRGVQAIAEELDGARLADRLLEFVLQGTAAERACLYQPEGEGWVCVASAGAHGGRSPNHLAAHVGAEGAALDLAEARRRGLLAMDGLDQEGLRSMWITPLRRAGRVEAVLYLDTRHLGGAFGPAARRYVEALGTQATIVRAHAATLAEAEASAMEARAAHDTLRHAHDRLRSSTVSRARLEGILAAITDGVIVVDAHGRPSLVNPAATAWLGPSPDPELLATLADEDDPWLTTVDGDPIPVRVVQAPLTEADGTSAGTVVLVSDMTARHEVEEALRAARAHAEAASRAKSAFLANMSHELRTPLNAIIGYAELLEETSEGDAVEDLHRIQRAGAHLLALINDVLDLSKIEADRMELLITRPPLVDLIQPVREQAEMLAAARGNQCVWRIEDPDLAVRCDVMRSRQILLNLISNAAKFTEEGTIGVHIAREGEEVVFQVQDTGIGIAPDALEKVFDAFQQADASVAVRYGGTGLGLALSRRLAEEMGGTLTARSTLGEGSVFELRLPAG